MANYISPQQKDNLLADASSKKYSKEHLAKKYDLSIQTIRKYISLANPTDRKHKKLTEEERLLIKDAYKDHESDNRYEKIKYLINKFKRSECTIRSIISDKPTKEHKITYFDPKQPQF